MSGSTLNSLHTLVYLILTTATFMEWAVFDFELEKWVEMEWVWEERKEGKQKREQMETEKHRDSLGSSQQCYSLGPGEQEGQ